MLGSVRPNSKLWQLILYLETN